MENEDNKGLIDKKASEDGWASLVSVAFCQFSFGDLILFSLSLILLETQSFLGALLESVAYLDAWRKKEEEELESVRGHQDQQLQRFFLQVLNCMYDFLTIFGMHSICMWFIGHDLSLAWRIVWIDNGFTQPFHFWDSHGVVGSFLCFSGWFSRFLQLGLS